MKKKVVLLSLILGWQIALNSIEYKLEVRVAGRSIINRRQATLPHLLFQARAIAVEVIHWIAYLTEKNLDETCLKNLL